jgi:putative heme-binding domain-containing protein
MRFARFWMAVVLSLAANSSGFSQKADWIWYDDPEGKVADGEVRYFRRVFNIASKVLQAELQASADNQFTAWINGKEVGSSDDWKKPLKVDVTDKLSSWGDNVLAIQARNNEGVAAVVAVLTLEQEYGKRQIFVSNEEWLSSVQGEEGWQQLKFQGNGWRPVKLIAKLGAEPWGDVLSAKAAGATPAEELTVPAGFKVELLRSAQVAEGSWVGLAVDHKGRLYISPQTAIPNSGFRSKDGWGGIWRATVGKDGQITAWDKVQAPVGAAMGMLWAFDSLYVNGNGPDGTGIYRVRDTNGDDQLDQATLFRKVPGGSGEHGAHAMVVGPDNRIYIAHGNSTPLIEGIAKDSPMQQYHEDHLLSRVWDPVATFFDNLKVPYGYVLRTDADGAKWELFASGFRNQYDIDFNADGELFTYDSDMEWDVGLPWYRPTRILHITSGAEFGFREGSTKWPEYYPDSLPAPTDIGLGSPTGVKFGTKSNFPEKYQRAFFAMDWTFGRIIAVHLTPKGSSYTATFEDFVKGKGLPVTDLEFGPDGAMYFTVGGRGTQGGLYRVSYVGASDKVMPASAQKATAAVDAEAAKARTLRRHLEVFHGKQDPRAIDASWPQLDSDDRFLRYAARLAIESQPVQQWRERALAEPKPRAGLQALLALVRCGSKSDQEPLLNALARWPLDSLDEPLKLDKLRVIELALVRHGRPSDDLVKVAQEKLGRQYPAKSFALNRELSQLLVALNAPDVVTKTVQLLNQADKQEEQIWYANVLREAKGNWMPDQRAQYFAWFQKAGGYRGGNSFTKFIDRIKDQALASVPPPDRPSLAALAITPQSKLPELPKGPARQFVKNWTVADLAPDLEKVARGRNFARGKEIFTSVLCLQCHHFGQEGGNMGPDLTAAANRYSRRDLLEAIVEPSKGISEQYASFVLSKQNGESVVGQVVEENKETVTVVTDAVAGTRVQIPRGEVKTKEMSPVSLMPPGLINVLSKEEVLDLLAYIESAGNAQAPNFAPVSK